MRCRCEKCHYNEDGYCGQPDYVWIDSSGQCDQMFIPTVEAEVKRGKEGASQNRHNKVKKGDSHDT